MTQAMTATTSQDALNALLCQAMPPQGYWSDEQYRNQDRFWLGADVVVEVVSPDDPGRDLVVKRADYAEAAIPEYWIVDPRVETVTVLTLAGGAYVEHGVFSRGEAATSPLLDGLTIAVTAMFDFAKG